MRQVGDSHVHSPCVQERELWLRFRRGDQDAAMSLFATHRNLVDRLSEQIRRRLPAYVGIDDLRSAGYEALWNAMQAYDPDQGVPFTAYARLRVRGAMLDELRKSDPLTRSQRTALKQQVHYAYRTQLVSLEADERQEWIVDDNAISPEEAAVRADEIAALNRALAKLTRQEQLVLALVFMEGLTLAETADVLQLSRSRVSTIYKEALRSLRGSLMSERKKTKRP